MNHLIRFTGQINLYIRLFAVAIRFKEGCETDNKAIFFTKYASRCHNAFNVDGYTA